MKLLPTLQLVTLGISVCDSLLRRLDTVKQAAAT